MLADPIPECYSLADSISHFPARITHLLPHQHELKEEADARTAAREKTVQDRGQGAADALRSEEALRDAAREEDQVAGPWGFEKLREEEEEDEGGGKKKKKAYATKNPGLGDDEEAGGGTGKGGRVHRQGMAGVRDGLGVFEISVGDGEFHGLNGGGNIDGVDNSEVQLFQPLQHAAHEER